MKEIQFDATCPTCGRENEVRAWVREDSFGNFWESVHCAYCGLKIDDIQAARTPKTTLKEETENDVV